jgi:peroxiredoxin
MIGVALYAGSRSSDTETVAVGKEAPAFKLASSSGGDASLSDYSGRNVLIYFNEGVGCDACFYQTVELEKHRAELDDAGVSLVAIVVNPLEQLRPELVRFGIETPYLVDEAAEVSEAYGMLGKGMHANLPGHGFVLVDGSGQIRWQREYPSMYVPTAEIIDQIRPYLG